MKEPDKKPTVRLVGEDGNAFAILWSVQKALVRAGADDEYIHKFLYEAMAQEDYDHLLITVMKYVNVI